MAGLLSEIVQDFIRKRGKQLIDPRANPYGIPVRPEIDMGMADVVPPSGAGGSGMPGLLPLPGGSSIPPRIPTVESPIIDRTTGRPGVGGRGAEAATILGAGAAATGLAALDNAGPRAPTEDPSVKALYDQAAEGNGNNPVDKYVRQAHEIKQRQAEATGQSLREVEVTAKRKIMEAIPEEEKGWFEALNESIDLTTFGLTLMALNNGEMGMGQAIGTAMLAGKKARYDEKMDQFNMEQDRYKQYLDTIKADATSRTADAAGVNANTNIRKAEDAARLGQQNANSRSLSAQASMQRAAAASLLAATGGQLINSKAPTSTERVEAQNYLQEALGETYRLKVGDKGRPGDEALVQNGAALIQEIRARYKAMGKTPSREDIKAEIRRYAAPVIQQGFNTQGWDNVIPPDAVTGLDGASSTDPRVAELQRLQAQLQALEQK